MLKTGRRRRRNANKMRTLLTLLHAPVAQCVGHRCMLQRMRDFGRFPSHCVCLTTSLFRCPTLRRHMTVRDRIPPLHVTLHSDQSPILHLDTDNRWFGTRRRSTTVCPASILDTQIIIMHSHILILCNIANVY